MTDYQAKAFIVGVLRHRIIRAIDFTDAAYWRQSDDRRDALELAIAAAKDMLSAKDMLTAKDMLSPAATVACILFSTELLRREQLHD
jgi:chromosome condensin MukBEF ATPase and DNA-binding subunit MukB